jgi:succinyl-diaminopimelate desuccinylase
VPDEFWINVNHRFPPGRGRDHVERVFDGLLKEAGGRARYEIADFAPSGSADLDHPLLQGFVANGLVVRPKQAWTDVARFTQYGVAAANFGPGLTTQAHQQNEYAELPLLLENYERLRVFLEVGP